MHHFSILDSIVEIPEPSDPDMAELGVRQWLEASQKLNESLPEDLAEWCEALSADPKGRKLIDALFGNSPFLTFCCVKDPVFFRALVNSGPDYAYGQIIEDISANRKKNLNEEDLSRLLRVAKRQVALTIAIADIIGLWPLGRITMALSDFADATLSAAATLSLQIAEAQGAFELDHPDDPERDSGLIIVGMGKLGARELNYSSDIDLIILYDRDRIKTSDPDGLQNQFVRLTRSIVRLMDERTSEGYVFRTDLRLRPDAGATPLAISALAAETYYESLGQNWERAAMIKARPVAGDIDSGLDFLKRLEPYVWRKNLDFAAIQDIHSIKRQINAQKGGQDIKAYGHNIKLGRGGIREIEFFAQTQQLIWGGREVGLRSPATISAIQALADHSRCEQVTASELVSSYEFLRRIEHRLQMINDEQTQVLPESPEVMTKLAVFLGYAEVEAFTQDLVANLELVAGHYGHLFGDSPSLAAEGETTGNLVFTGVDADPETLSTIAGLGYLTPETVDAAVRGWHHGRYRATRSTRAREILTELMPILLKAIAATPDPDTAFVRFDGFLEGLPSGVQLFSMFQANPQLLDLVALIIGSAPRLADHMSRRPSVLDSVLTRDFFDPPPNFSALNSELSRLLEQAEHEEDGFNIARRWAHDRRFQIGVQQLTDRISSQQAALGLSDIAETAIRQLYPRTQAEFACQHGRIEGAEMAVVALGKLGSREMTAGSDLDLIFIYHAGGDAETSDGPKPLTPSHYFARLSQRLINSLTALTSEGSLYEVDMRLRPSGNSGPIASALDGFVQYHAETAWTWEHMALTRARVIVGSDDLSASVGQAIHDVLTRHRDNAALLRDVADMRNRLVQEKGVDSLWSLKQLRGGLIDVEFIVQYLVLKHGHGQPEVTVPSTAAAIAALADAGVLDKDAAARLSDALDFWHSLLGLLTLTISGEITAARESEMSSALKADLVQAAGAKDFAQLESQIKTTAQWVHGLFNELIAEPASAEDTPA